MSARKYMIDATDVAVKAGARLEVVCEAIGASIRTIQRWRKDLRDDGRKNNRITSSNAMTPKERKTVLDVACSPEFRDLSPNQIVPILAEKDLYVGSESTFYRFLKKAGLLIHRSNAKAPERHRPDEITATSPNQVWTWDITYCLTLTHGVFLYLYLILDIWDRSIVGWAVHGAQSGPLAADLLNETCVRQKVGLDELTVHQDNGGPMVSVEFLAALARWGQASYSRPGVSDDNPFSESLFRTLKYRPGYPERFETIEEAVKWIGAFVAWYNSEHRHSAIGFVTPLQRRCGEDVEILASRRKTYERARLAHPERWSGGIRKWERPVVVTLNPREKKKSGQKKVA